MSERPRRILPRLLFVAVLCVAGGVAYDWRQVQPIVQSAIDRVRSKPQETAKTAPKEAPAVPVSAAEARTGDFPEILTSLGTVQPYNTVLVRSRVDGQVMSINFTEGQIVQ